MVRCSGLGEVLLETAVVERVLVNNPCCEEELKPYLRFKVFVYLDTGGLEGVEFVEEVQSCWRGGLGFGGGLWGYHFFCADLDGKMVE